MHIGEQRIHTNNLSSLPIDLSAIHYKCIFNSRHTGEGWYPAFQITPHSGQSRIEWAVPLRGCLSFAWIPAYAGMTKWVVPKVVANYGNLIIHAHQPPFTLAGKGAKLPLMRPDS